MTVVGQQTRPTQAPSPVGAQPTGSVVGSKQASAGRTTPAQLRTYLIAILVLAVLVAILSGFVSFERLSTTNQIKDRAEPAIVSARKIQANMAEADALAANDYLVTVGVDPDQGRCEDPNTPGPDETCYQQALDAAGQELVAASTSVGDDPDSQRELGEIQHAIAQYAGAVETARANNRQGLPVGAAYLEDASALLRAEGDETNCQSDGATSGVYAKTDCIANRAQDRYLSSYNSQVGLQSVLAILVVVLAFFLLVALLITQRFISKTFKRSINVPLAIATIFALAVLIWSSVAYFVQYSNVQAAHEEGYDGVKDYIEAQSLAYRARGTELLFVVARGNADTAEFDSEANALGNQSGEIGLLPKIVDRSQPGEGGTANAASEAWSSYLDAHGILVANVEFGDLAGAQEQALGPSRVAFDDFTEELDAGLRLNEDQFQASMNAATGPLRPLTYGGPILAVFTTLLAWRGIQRRIDEYR